MGEAHVRLAPFNPRILSKVSPADLFATMGTLGGGRGTPM
jgi:hypothetical protein